MERKTSSKEITMHSLSGGGWVVCVLSLLTQYLISTLNYSTRCFTWYSSHMWLQCESWIWNKWCAVFWKEIFQCNLMFLKETRRTVLLCILTLMYELKKRWRYSPFKWVLHLCLASSSSVIHKPSAAALTLRKLPFYFWSLPSFIPCPLQCKASNLNIVCGLYPIATSIQSHAANLWRGRSPPLV